MKRIWILLSVVVLASCGGGGNNTPPPTPVTLSISPSFVTVAAGAMQTFTANVSGTSNTAVTWQVGGVAGGNATLGTITTSGVYTAPLSPPPNGQVEVRAVLQADATKSGASTVTVTFSNATLQGDYTFTLTGGDANGIFIAVGSFYADGQGHISNGVLDLNHGAGVSLDTSFTGTYSVATDGRGAATLIASPVIPNGADTFHFVLLSNARAQMVEFNQASSGEGLILKRDETAFQPDALTGDFAFGFDGIDASEANMSAAGRLTATSGGAITGVQDVNDAGAVTTMGALTGSYTLDTASGRAHLTLTDAQANSTNYWVHLVTRDTAFFVEEDFLPAVVGTLRRQQAVPFSIGSLLGDYAFQLSGASTLAMVARAGRFTANGAGVLSGGVFDENFTGSVAENLAFTGTVPSIDSGGRGTAALIGPTPDYDLNVSFFMVTPQEAFVVSNDTFEVTSGTLLAQTGVPFATSSVQGSYGFRIYDPASDTDFVGQMTAPGSGTLTGSYDVNTYDTTNQLRVLYSAVPYAGTYAGTSEGRAAISLALSGETVNLRSYAVSASRLFVIELSDTFVSSGTVEKQF